jgi:broad specificity phosphatase PhoE
MKTLTLTAICLLIGISLFGQNNAPTEVFLVRHAEKILSDPTNKDPLLTLEGHARAKTLAKKLRRTGISVIYCTDYQRVKLTAEPLARKKNITIKLYDARNLKGLAKIITEEHQGQKILVVGHSNTVLESIEALGGTRPVATINDNEYDYFFVLTQAQDKKVLVRAEKYGVPSAKQSDGSMKTQ